MLCPITFVKRLISKKTNKHTTPRLLAIIITVSNYASCVLVVVDFVIIIILLLNYFFKLVLQCVNK